MLMQYCKKKIDIFTSKLIKAFKKMRIMLSFYNMDTSWKAETYGYRKLQKESGHIMIAVL